MQKNMRGGGSSRGKKYTGKPEHSNPNSNNKQSQNNRDQTKTQRPTGQNPNTNNVNNNGGSGFYNKEDRSGRPSDVDYQDSYYEEGEAQE